MQVDCFNPRIGIIGLGYVGLPLAVEFAKVADVVGFDIDGRRVFELINGCDRTQEVSVDELQHARRLTFSGLLQDLQNCNFYIITVPTPVNDFMQPDLAALISASESVGKVVCQGDIVVYESTVYPGATEEVCLPIIEETSGLKLNQDFFAGYSPERINPGDRNRRLPDIKKITSGSTPETALLVDHVYRLIIRAGTHCAPSIRVAEAAKVIENTQRDVNIALINEISIILHKMGIDTLSVLEAAGTKWNFLDFRPGLVGGHCIGVDPYYLTHKAQSIGYHPKIILASRRLNEGMGSFVAETLVRAMAKKNLLTSGSRVLVMGLSFKENCQDLRNTRVTDLVKTLQDYALAVDVYDPWVDRHEAERCLGFALNDLPQNGTYDAIIVVVGHRQFIEMGAVRIRAFGKPDNLLYDVKSIFPAEDSDLRL